MLLRLSFFTDNICFGEWLTTQQQTMNCHRTFATTSGASFAFFAQHPRPSRKTVEAFAASVNSSSSSSSYSSSSCPPSSPNDRPHKQTENSRMMCCRIAPPRSNIQHRRDSEETIRTINSLDSSLKMMEYESFPENMNGGSTVSSSASAQV